MGYYIILHQQYSPRYPQEQRPGNQRVTKTA